MANAPRIVEITRRECLILPELHELTVPFEIYFYIIVIEVCFNDLM